MRQQRTEPAAIEAEIAQLRSLALDALRRRWRAVFGRTPPAGLSKDLLGRMIAWRMQEQAFGGLDRESLRFLEGLARHGSTPRRQLKPGTAPDVLEISVFKVERGLTVREWAHDAGAPPDLTQDALERIVGANPPPMLLREGVVSECLLDCRFHQLGGAAQAQATQLLDHSDG